MKIRLLLAGATAVLLSACATTKPIKGIHQAGVSGRSGQHLMVRTTAYTHTEAGGIKNGIGGRLRFKSPVRSAAADWSWLPLGTRFRLAADNNTQQYVIEDYGSALVGKQTIDMYMPTMSMVRNWGVKHVEIEILEWGSKPMSLKLLEGRQRRDHVRQMVSSLKKQGIRPLAAN